jgi:hypothetical protein
MSKITKKWVKWVNFGKNGKIRMIVFAINACISGLSCAYARRDGSTAPTGNASAT